MSDTKNTLTEKGFEMPASFIDRLFSAASIDEAGDVYLEARVALDHDSAEWRAIVDEMARRYAAEPLKPAVPLVSLMPGGIAR